MSISIQLYSLREIEDQIALLPRLAEFGVASVEGFAGVFDDPASYREAMDAVGITMPTGHFGIDLFDNGVEQVVAIAQILGVKKVFGPYLEVSDRPMTKEGYVEFAGRLAEIADALAVHGLVFGWHNHDFEFEPVPDGSIPMEVMLEAAPTLQWEADLGWLIRAGVDPKAWLSRYGDRVQALHIKDVASKGENLEEDGWATLGEGTVDWPEMIDLYRTHCPDVELVLEHDNPSDPIRYASTSAATLKTLLEA